jgi:hypothetical protein|tara:strand:- start:532 stop:681 length:150 start_codon:yes stop_codon:yes gene_type:complete
MTWEKGQVRVGAGGRPMPDPVIEKEKPVTPKKTSSSKSKKTEKKDENKE